ncbi:substrate-binding domain-containing protein [Enterococcus sp. RIT-PI-f]|uniref:substrate-binding domain-containing protein n=1 Tax=Enterococcus sp. RIT-PI-f TaxID=1690244 RepID=UPI0006B8F712|nr:substrate-binding domain-containing protein [Enterococcus sp. RIT-PI-f]KPG70626.1 LacI family transcriptional regulator [Enterococcus sp. RIT-PI-f]
MTKITMQMIADQLSISKNSVSQAIRNKPGVSQKTKNLVLQKAEELGYKYKKSNATVMHYSFLLIATEFVFSQTSFFGEILKSIISEIHTLDHQISTYTITEEDIQITSLPEKFESYDGIIILSHSDDDYLEKLIHSGIPVILVDHHGPTLVADTILTNNTDGAYDAVSLLIENQHSTIGFIGDIRFSPSYYERFVGYQKALFNHEKNLNPHFEITEIEESQGALFHILKQLDTMPEAWFCVNSGLAFMVNTFLQTAGYTIPNDISILCFDDTEFTRTAIPQITNVATDLHHMGKLTVRTLIKRIEECHTPFIQQKILPQLTIRGSVRRIDE